MDGQRAQKPKWWEPAPEKSANFPAETCLTQCGKNSGFRPQPRFDDPQRPELTLSVLEGRYEVADAIRATFRRPARLNDRARYFIVRNLTEHQYWAFSSPSKGIPTHGSISAPIRERSLDRHRAWWSADGRVTLEEIAESVHEEEGGSNG